MADGTAFAVDLEYFFLKTDEMLEKYMDQSAANAFDCGMVATALVSLACLLTGWYPLPFTACKKKWGLKDDSEPN